MRKGWFAAGVAVVFTLPAAAAGTAFAQAEESAAAAVSPQRALVNRYCVTCHNERVVAGNGSGMMAEQLRLVGLALDSADVDNVAADPELWEKVVRKLRVGAMPPQPRARPDKQTYDGFRRWLEDELDRVAATRPNPGRTQALHRLNQAEYRNVIRDLLDLEIDVEALIPPDAPDRNGFDNIATSLSLSPALFERYVSAAKKIGRLAIGEAPTGGAEIATYDVPLNLIQNDRQSEDLPFGSRGGAAVRHHFPVDGEYRIKVRLQTNYVGYIRGIDAAHEIEFRLDGQRIERFTFGGEAPGMPAPISFAGNIRGTDDWEDYTLHADDPLEVTTTVSAGPHTIGVSFPREMWEEEGVLQPWQTGFALAINEMPDGNPALSSVQITGPLSVDGPGDTPSRRRIFTCRPDPGATDGEAAACAGQILGSLARRAYRRPVDETDVATLLEFYEWGRADGGFEKGIQFALERLLADPDFLYRVERDPVDIPSGTTYPISDVELASRLSFFLWSSIPDDGLLAAAENGTLSEPAVLDAQVRRMLADPRSQAMVDNFAGQWLYLRNMGGVYPDPNIFPEFDENLREAFTRETELFIRNQLRSDASVLELLSADYTYVNQRLAEHYGIPEHLREPVPAGAARRRAARRPPGPRQRHDRDLVPEPHVAGAARQVGAREPARGAAAGAAAGHPRPRGAERGRRAGVDARGDGPASREPRVLGLPRPDGPDRVRAAELRRHRRMARRQRGRALPSTLPACCRAASTSRAAPGSATCSWTVRTRSSAPLPRSC